MSFQPHLIPDGDVPCSLCGTGKKCPIAGKTPPAEICVFSTALRTMDSGLMIGRPSTGEYVYENPYAKRVHEKLGDSIELRQLLASSPDLLGATIGRQEASHVTRHIIRKQSTTVGLTLYLTGKDLALVALKELSQDAFFHQPETPISQSSDGQMVLRIFSQLRHEVGNPLNSIKITLQVLKENLDTFSRSKVLSYIARTVQEVGRLEKLLASLREFSRQDNLPVSEIDLHHVVKQFQRIVEEQCQTAGVTLSLQLDEEGRFALANTATVTQILHNLLRNALEAMQDNPGHIEIRTRSGRTGTVCIEFRDDGPGISQSDLPMVLKPMFTTKAGGSGLGLALVDRLVTRMGGAVTVSSEPNRQTQVAITLRRGAAT